jgi:hypothetical protein
MLADVHLLCPNTRTAAAVVLQALSPGWAAVRSLVQVNIANWQAQEAVARRWKQPSKPPTWEDVIMMVRGV